MSEQDDDEASAGRSPSHDERIDADRVVSPNRDYLVPKFELPDHLVPKFELPDHLVPKFELPEHLVPKFELPEHLVPKFELPAMDHLLGISDRVTGWLDSAVPRVDMAALSNVVRTAAAVNQMHDTLSAAARTVLDIDRAYRGIEDLLSPALRHMHSGIDEVSRLLAPDIQTAAQVWTTQINDLMQGWSALSRFGHRLADKALHLALITRDALVNNPDRSAVRTTVINFMRGVLGYTGRPTDARIEAVTSALLDDSWLPSVGPALLDADYDPIAPLRKVATYQHGLWRPLTETKRRGRLIASLEEPERVNPDDDSDNPTCLKDRLEAPDFVPEDVPITHPAIKRVFDSLSPTEQKIVKARFCHGARTWDDAAIMCGRPISEGETVRRKFLRLKTAERRRRSA